MVAGLAFAQDGVRRHSSGVTVPVQYEEDAEFDVGSILVADRDLKDPNFAETVILIVKYDDEGTLGLVLNRITDVPVARALDDWKEAKGHAEPVFLGGPVEKTSILGLVRSRARISQAHPVLTGVHLISEPPQLHRNLEIGLGSDKFRLYVGYAGWAPEQLEEEVDLGAWHVFPGDVNLVFDSDPGSLWMRMIKRAETQIAWALQPPSLVPASFAR